MRCKELERIPKSPWRSFTLSLLAGLLLTSPASAQGRISVGWGRDRGHAEVEVLTRGPVHEAYAVAATVEVEPPQVVSRRPPQPIDEYPPDETVDFGDGDSEWVPGYWSYDDDRNDYIWISGAWRVPPPGCSWVPGYWSEAPGGYQYTPGFWMPADDDDDDEVEYLPAPPRPVDEGPIANPPSDRHVWVPGIWYWENSYGWDVDTYRDPRTGRETRVYQKRQSGYVWRPGYWIVTRPEWVWIPATYVWSPRGYVFCEGHWDYPIERRGVIYAPVAFERPVYLARGYRYTPSYAIDINIAVGSFFTRISTGRYYYGDYYDTTYLRAGYCPWFETATRYRVYDPLFVQTRTRYVRVDRDWDVRLHRDYDFRVQHVNARPARTLRIQESRTRSIVGATRDRDRDGRADAREVALAKPLSAITRSSDSNVRIRSIDSSRKTEIANRGVQVRNFEVNRKSLEAGGSVIRREATGTGGSTGTVRSLGSDRDRNKGNDSPQGEVKSERVKIDRSPLSGRSLRSRAPEKPQGEDAPPEPKKLKSGKRGQDQSGERRIIRREKKDDKP